MRVVLRLFYVKPFQKPGPKNDRSPLTGNSEKFVRNLYQMDKEEMFKELEISAAQLQGYFMQHKFDQNQAIKNVNQLRKKI